MEKYFPKILILLEPFNNITGMGITLTNLFKNWPKENIAIAANNLDIKLCREIRACKYYLPLSEAPINHQKNIKNNPLTKVIKKTLKYLYQKIGINDFRVIHISKELKDLILKFQPDIIFTALGSIDRMNFINEVLNFYDKARLATYIVDDWPHTRQNGRWFPSYWKRKYQRDFKRILDKSDYLFSICPAMSENYLKLYNKIFYPFHNPVDFQLWSNAKFKRRYNKDIFSVVYVGKINQDTHKNILALAKTVHELNNIGYNIKFDVYSPSKNTIKYERFNGFEIFTAVSNDRIPNLLKSYDLLFLTLGFSKYSRAYTKLSMPTKLTEYLASGVPIFILAPDEIALTQYVKESNSGFICTSSSLQALREQLITIISKKELRERYAKKALEEARKHDISTVRKRFEEILSN